MTTPFNQHPAKHPPVVLLPGEVISYERKSTSEEGANKSIADQKEVNFETAQTWGLPLCNECQWDEAVGFGGNLWWDGGGGSGVPGDVRPAERARPVLTKIIRGVVAGKIKCIIVYSLCRLWRDVGICEAALKLLAHYGCLLYDRDGPVDISTPDGRNAVRSAAVAGQNMREMAQITSPRGIRKNRDKGKRVVSANVLGFRNTPGKRSGVIHIPHEQEMVVEAFNLFDNGDGRVDDAGQILGPVSPIGIARLWMERGFQWPQELSRGHKRIQENEAAIYVHQITQVLTDCRYQGRQPHEGKEWACPAFLKADGIPVVEASLYERVQEKMQRLKRGSNATHNSYPLAGLMRCGICGQTMGVGRTTVVIEGEKKLVAAWKALRYDTWCWCTHDLPMLQTAFVDTYIDQILTPLLCSEIRDHLSSGMEAEARNACAGLERALTEAERQYKEVLPSYMGSVPPAVLAEQFRRCEEEIERTKAALRQAEGRIQSMSLSEAVVANISRCNESLRRDAIRAVVRWVAVIPTDSPKLRDRSTGYKVVPGEEAGRMVWLTAWGTLHTAFIYRDRVPGQMKRVGHLRPATWEESIHTVCDFPEPARFVAGLERSYKARKYDFAPGEVAPGFWDAKIEEITIFDE